jgi:autotransporter-associated beta strand protein
MTRHIWNRWLRSLVQPRVKTAAKRSRLALEHLETRLAPAQFTWDGGGTDNRFSNPLNWVNNVAPTPNGGHDLVFGTDAPLGDRTADNDFAAASFNSIIFAASNYTLTGNGITLGNATSGGAIRANAGASNNLINFTGSIQLVGNSSTGAVTFDIGSAGATVTVASALTGATGTVLTKQGVGRLILAGNNIGYSGRVSVLEGPLRVLHQNALGTPGNLTTTAGQAQATTITSTATRAATLEIDIAAGATIGEALFLSGAGIASNGALLNVAGHNVWTGNIQLDNNSTIGTDAGSLTIQGVIGDQAAGWSLTKEGLAKLILDPINPVGTPVSQLGNSYRGRTVVNNGILAIRHSLALGNDATQTVGVNDTVVNVFPAKSGTLQLDFTPNAARIDPNVILTAGVATGFTVPRERLTLNGPGLGYDPTASSTTPRGGLLDLPKTLGNPGQTLIGALHNLSGNNTWAQNISLWSGDNSILVSTTWNWGTVGIGAEADTTLTITGQIIDTNLAGTVGPTGVINGDYSLIKTRPGTLVLVRDNTYRGRTEVLEGFLNIRDSRALGTVGADKNGTTVFPGGTLELQADDIPDSNPAGVSPDGKMHLNTDIVISAERLFLMGTGAGGTGFTGTSSSGKGALRNIVGTNEVTGNIPLMTNISRTGAQFFDRGAFIGVEPDQDPLNSDGLAFNDFSQLTLSGQVQNGTGVAADLFKVGLGELVLTADAPGVTGNTYTGLTFIVEGWVTARHDRAFGADILGRGVSRQPETHVEEGASIHLKRTRSTGLDINLLENLWLAGDGIDHRFDEMNHKGALLNLSGFNTVPYNVNLIAKPNFPQVGIGADLDPTATSVTQSELTFTGLMRETPLPFDIPRGSAAGGSDEDRYLIDTGSTAGSVNITYDFFNVPDRLRVYYEGNLVLDTGFISTPGGPVTVTVNYGPPTNLNPVDDTFVEIVMNEGSSGIPGTAWTYTASVNPTNMPAGINKLGRQRIYLQGHCTFSGDTNVVEGTLRVQSDTSMGVGVVLVPTGPASLTPGTTNVMAGAAIEFERSVASLSGGISGACRPSSSSPWSARASPRSSV